jgi:phage tail-like protein
MAEENEKLDLLSYLPAIYEEVAQKENSPLRALLLISDSFFSDIEQAINEIDEYFDPSRTPSQAQRDFLSWLASWVALTLDESWSERKKRYFVRNAAQIYRYRGTTKGLKFMLSQFFDKPIDVDVEEWAWIHGMEIGIEERCTIGVDTVLIENVELNHCFKVIWRRSSRDLDDEFISRIRNVIDLEKPAHTRCYFDIQYPQKKVVFKPMVIGILTEKASSVIGFCYIG